MSDYTHMYELRADVLNADPDDYDNSREFALREPLQENLERLVPYLTTDGDCHVSLLSWYDGSHAHVVAYVNCNTRSNADTLLLLLSVGNLHGVNAEVTGGLREGVA